MDADLAMAIVVVAIQAGLLGLLAWGATLMVGNAFSETAPSRPIRARPAPSANADVVPL